MTRPYWETPFSFNRCTVKDCASTICTTCRWCFNKICDIHFDLHKSQTPRCRVDGFPQAPTASRTAGLPIAPRCDSASATIVSAKRPWAAAVDSQPNKLSVIRGPCARDLAQDSGASLSLHRPSPPDEVDDFDGDTVISENFRGYPQGSFFMDATIRLPESPQARRDHRR